jgi:uncharacterized cupredoxin-like copper-binding protein
MSRNKLKYLVVMLIVLLAGCGARQPNAVTIRMRDMRFEDGELHVQVGQPVTLRVINHDGYAHAIDFDDFAIHQPLAAEQSVDLTITPDHAGRYPFYCSLPGHEKAGMVGELVVDG